MAKKNKKISQDVRLLAIGTGVLAVALAIIVASFIFLINGVLPAITPDGEAPEGETVHFNLEGFEELGL